MYICFFDIDGTLVNTRGAGGHALAGAMASQFGIDARHDDVPTSGRTDRAIVADLFRRHRVENNDVNWRHFLAGYVEHLQRQLPLRQGEVLPGIVQLLSQLAARDDVAVGLLTGNTQRGAQLKLQHFAIDHHFAFGGFGDDHLERNDVAAHAVTVAAGHLAVQPVAGRTVVIGDTPLDILCARHIGAKAVAVATGIHPRHELETAEPDILVDDLSDGNCVLELLVT